jgi:hypothetical protein
MFPKVVFFLLQNASKKSSLSYKRHLLYRITSPIVSHNHHMKPEPDYAFQYNALRTWPINTDHTIKTVIYLALFHIILMILSIPLVTCFEFFWGGVSGGVSCVNERGYIDSISSGFEAYTVATTTLWGVGVSIVSSARFLHTAQVENLRFIVGNLAILISIYSAFLTMRVDVLKELHEIYATCWIVSAFVFHFCVTVHLSKRGIRSVSVWTFAFGIVSGLSFVTSVVVLNLDDHPLELTENELTTLSSVLEISTVLCIFLLDIFQCLQLLGFNL